MKKALFSLAMTTTLGALTACGGGGDDAAKPVSPSSLSQQTVSDTGATLIPANTASDQSFGATKVFEVVASVGDTWRIALNPDDRTFQVTTIGTSRETVNALVGSRLQIVEDGDFTHYYGDSSGNASSTFKLTLDKRTQTVVGWVSQAAQAGGTSRVASRVSGTAYQIANPAKLAGDYTYLLNATYTDSNGVITIKAQPGHMRLKWNGTALTGLTCPNSHISTDEQLCVDDAGARVQSGPVTPQILTFGQNSQTGRIYLATFDGQNRGDIFYQNNIHVQMGDRGVVLAMDYDFQNQLGARYLGAIHAAKQVTLSKADVVTTMQCTTGYSGSTAHTLQLKSDNSYSYSWSDHGLQTEDGTFELNQVSDSFNTNTAIKGAVVLTDRAGNASPKTLVPLSSSLWVMRDDYGTSKLTYCAPRNPDLVTWSGSGNSGSTPLGPLPVVPQ